MTHPDDGGDASERRDPSELETIRRLARELSFRTDDEVLEACLETADRLERKLDIDRSRRPEGEPVGRRSDDEYDALLSVYDEPRSLDVGGPCEGMTVAIKDNIAVRGLRMTVGLADYGYVPSYDAVVVERLLEAGAAIVGKANMDALAIGPEGVWSEIAQVRNPIDAERVPGGSSSGSAVAVATGMADAALGTDAGGSVRKPAAYNELVGVKPTRGTVPSHGKVTCATTLGTIGPLTRTVEEAARVLETIAGPDVRDPNSTGASLGSLVDDLDEPLSCTVGLPDTFLDCADPGVEAVIRDLADAIADETACSVREVPLDNAVSSLPSYLSGPEFAWLIRQGAVNHGAGVASDPAWRDVFRSREADGFNEHVTRRKLPGAYLDAKTDGASYAAAHEAMMAFQESLAAVFEEVDLLLSPTVPALPPKRSADIESLPRNLSINCQPFNLSGSPAVAVPAGRADGLPVSAQLAAPRMDDALALRGARMVERVRD